MKALVEVLNDDDEIEEDQLLYVLEDGRPLTKQEVCTAHEICLQPFLLGLWHYVLTTRGTNTVGKETYDAWCPPKERARREYKKTIGEDSQRDIRIGYCTDFRTDNEVIEPEIIEMENDNDKTEEFTESAPPQQNVNNPLIFNFTQNGNNNTQIGHVEHYHAGQKG